MPDEALVHGGTDHAAAGRGDRLMRLAGLNWPRLTARAARWGVSGAELDKIRMGSYEKIRVHVSRFDVLAAHRPTGACRA